jgi:uncharacterized RDD family membrane protein YckC
LNEQQWIDKMLDHKLRAGWGSRVISFIYDLIYLFLIMFFVSAFTTLWMMMIAQPPEDIELWEIRQYFKDNFPHLLLIDQIIKGVMFIAYFFIVPLISRDHRTIGMVTLGVSLMNDQGEDISRSQYLQRELIKWFVFPGFFLVFGAEKRTLHDKLSNTYMVLN